MTFEEVCLSIFTNKHERHSSLHVGDTLNVIGAFSSSPPTITISSKHNLLILHPDILLTATAISNAPQCTRRPLLQALLKNSSDVGHALVWGNMLHEVMQRCLVTARWDEAFMEELVDEVVRKGLSDLLRIGVGVDAAKAEVKKRAIGLRAFSERFVSDEPKVRISIMPILINN